MPPTPIKIYGNYQILLFFYRIFGLKMVSRGPGRYLKRFLRLVAPSWLNISPWRATATHFMPKTSIFNISETYKNNEKPHNLIHYLLKLSIDIKTPLMCLHNYVFLISVCPREAYLKTQTMSTWH